MDAEKTPGQAKGEYPNAGATVQPMTNDMSGQDPSKPVDKWVTGDEPATGPQLSYLETLAREAGEDVPSGLTKAQASELIDRLQSRSDRVADGNSGS